MTFPIDPTQFQSIPVRHLAWLCQAPTLYTGPLAFNLAGRLPPDTLEKLQKWDARPAAGPAVLTEKPHRRLGIYFEQLYACLLRDILDWEVLARNLPVRSAERTLGELDFVVLNPENGEVEHHEIAVKFYLGYADSAKEAPRWYGPNSRDRLDVKTQHLLEHQTRLSRCAETVTTLAGLAIRRAPRPRIFMPGYLFYPLDRSLSPPGQVSQQHARGRWIFLDQTRRMNTAGWVPLRKPNWLGPWIQAEAPDPVEITTALEGIGETGRPRLFANLEWDGETRLWKEQERVFVVPTDWPKRE
jgi:hypothetical protein